MEEPKHSTFNLAAVFAFLFASIGAFLGSLTLLGPVQYITTQLRSAQVDFRYEKGIVRFIILMLIAVTAWLAYRFTKKYERSEFMHKGKAVFIAGLVMLVVFAAVFSNPGNLKYFMPPESKVLNFVFGPYPDREQLERLKFEGYTAVISLLHPAVVPFEPQLIAEEEKNCAAVGIKFISAPMLPWISDNASSVKIIEGIAAQKKGRYYVHCYLGHDRVTIVKGVIEKHVRGAEINVVRKVRSLKTCEKFERGNVIRLTDEIYLTPFPTDDEIVAYLLNGEIKNIVNMMDPSVPDDQKWIEKEKAVAKTFNVNLIMHPIPAETTDVQIYKKAYEAIVALPPPTAVHGFRVDSPREKALIEIFKKGGK